MREQRERERELKELDRDIRTVFAYNLPLRADERDLFKFFSAAGMVEDVRIITDRNTRKSKGFAYIEYANRVRAGRRFPQAPGCAQTRMLAFACRCRAKAGLWLGGVKGLRRMHNLQGVGELLAPTRKWMSLVAMQLCLLCVHLCGGLGPHMHMSRCVGCDLSGVGDCAGRCSLAAGGRRDGAGADRPDAYGPGSDGEELRGAPAALPLSRRAQQQRRFCLDARTRPPP